MRRRPVGTAPSRKAFVHANLIEIVCGAATIAERSGPEFIPEPAGSSGEDVNGRLEQWCRTVADGDWSRFERRLALDGLTLETARRSLLPVRIPPGAKLPTWAETLAAVLSTKEESGRPSADRCLEAAAPLPFEDVCLPFVRVAQTHLRKRSDSAYHLLNDAAHGALERQLLTRLSLLSAQTLYLEFSLFRGWQRSGIASFLSGLSPQPSGQLYADFVRDLLGGKLVVLFREYSVLARRMATAVELWVDATAQMLIRVEHDSPALAAAFGNGGELGRVTGIQPGLSDPHDGGGTVALLTWDSGLKLVYKPRDLALDRAYNELLDWFNAHGAPARLRVCRILARPTYGWMEFVEHLPCESLHDAENYFRRAGMLLCLVYALRGADFHDENVIASRADPVLVDLEVLLQPRLREPVLGLTGPDDPAHQELAESVLGTGMLPWWLIMPDGRAWNLAGLGAGEEAESMYRVPQWRNVNSDAMELTYEYTKDRPRANVARLENEPLSPVRFEEQLVDGFERMYRILLDQREALLVTGGALSRFAHVPVRFVLRSTNVYGWYLQRGVQPQFLRDGAVASLLIDALSRELVRTPALWALLEVETQSLERMDIPWFATRSDSDSLLLGTDRAVEHCFMEPSYQLVMKRIGRMREDDLAWQIQMIRGSLQAYQTDGLAHLAADRATSSDRDGATTLTPEEALRQALALAQGLERQALRSEFGGASWIGLVPIPLTHRLQLQPVWYGLYDGACGIALFLAALEKTTNGAGYRDLCLAALQPFRAALLASRDDAPPYIGPHGELGVVIYGLVRVSGLLDEPTLREDARRLARYVTPERIASDREFDVLSGSAGIILGLLALYEVTSEQDLMGRAVACGRHLLEHRVQSAVGLRSWRTVDGQLLAGFSHGAAGIAYALLRLGRAAGESTFTDAALEAIAYEQSLFDPNEENWPRLSVAAAEGQNFPCGWCHGAPGIGLARVASLDIVDTPAVRADIDAALRTTRRVGLQSVDHLCCGNFSRLEFLLSAGKRLGRGELVALARRQAAEVVARATARGRYALRGWDRDVSAELSPGLFQGEAGIGYELLRLAYPEQVPSVLSFE